MPTALRSTDDEPEPIGPAMACEQRATISVLPQSTGATGDIAQRDQTFVPLHPMHHQLVARVLAFPEPEVRQASLAVRIAVIAGGGAGAWVALWAVARALGPIAKTLARLF